MAFGAPGVIGLDIGTSAVRAALLGNGRGKRSLLRFGQVALPPGAVMGGEIRDPAAVSDAISQLWQRTKFKSKKAVLGLANQRVVVRQIDIPFMEEKELRESLKFQVSEHIPMSVDAAELDFQKTLLESQIEAARVKRGEQASAATSSNPFLACQL
jgi:type IV pilus assembly protein PilM